MLHTDAGYTLAAELSSRCTSLAVISIAVKVELGKESLTMIPQLVSVMYS